jgi:DNA-binding transcriptional MocR family regulator
MPTDSATGIDLDSLEHALGGNAIKACLFSSSFNNPLGSTMSEEKKLAILELLARRRVPLIEDDIYGDIYFGAERPRPFAALDQRGGAIYCSSFSKTVAPGYRIGWIATNRHMDRVLAHKFALTLCGPALTQAAIADFLSSGGYDNHLRRIRRIFADNIGRMSRAVDRWFPVGTRVSQPAGGFVLWADLPKPFKARALFEAALERGVCFAPGDVFSAGKSFGNCLRLSCGHLWDARIERAVETLGALAKEAIDRGR